MQEEKVPENKRFINQKNDKQFQINMRLIAETSLANTITQNITEEEKIDVIIRLKSIHLQWLNIKRIQNLEVFEQLNILYLQHNHISKIEGLSHLRNLQYLALNDNHISRVENLKELKKLVGLNLNNNEIQEFEQEELPQNLQLVSFKNNPVCLDVDYKIKILKKLRALEMLDDHAITPAQRFKILGIFPQKLLTYSSQLKQFYTKRQLKQKLVEESKPILLNTEIVNEKQALSQIREKTRKYLYQNKQTFKKQTKEQVDNFNQKIQVSKKIRNIKENQQKQRQRRLNQIKDSTMNELMHNYPDKSDK